MASLTEKYMTGIAMNIETIEIKNNFHDASPFDFLSLLNWRRRSEEYK